MNDKEIIVNDLSAVIELTTKSGINLRGLSNVTWDKPDHYLIYRIVNLANGKYYIGQHKTTNPQDSYMGSGIAIENAIQHYGVSSFVKEFLFDLNSFDEANKKENELVQLSNCYPFDQMSYNLTVGGNSGDKFISKTLEERKQISKQISNTMKNWSDEQRNQHAKASSEGSLKYWNSLTEEEYNNICKHMSEMQTEIQLSRSPEEREQINKRISNTKRSYSKEQQTEITIKRKTTLSNLSDEIKEIRHIQNVERVKVREANKTKEQKDKQIATQKNTWSLKSEKEIQDGVDKWRNSMNARSDEEKKLTAQKKHDAMVNRSAEEKAKTQQKRSKTLENLDPKEKLRRGEHQRRQISGRRKMVHPLNLSRKIMVKKEDIQNYIDKGYVFTKPRKDDMLL